MPPSASATPPTQTTHRVPNRSSKPITRGGAGGEAGEGGLEIVAAEAGGTEVGAGAAVCARSAGSTGGTGSGGGEGTVCDGAAVPSDGRFRSSASSLVAMLRSARWAPFALTSAMMAITGADSTASTRTTSSASIEAPLRSLPEFYLLVAIDDRGGSAKPYSRSSRNGAASSAMIPRPMVSTAAIIRPWRPSNLSASDTIRIYGVAVGDALRSD